MRADWSARPAGRYVNIRKAPGLDPKPRISRKRLDAWLKSDVLRPILAAPRMSVCHFCRSCSRLAVVFPRPGTERPFARLRTTGAVTRRKQRAGRRGRPLPKLGCGGAISSGLFETPE